MSYGKKVQEVSGRRRDHRLRRHLLLPSKAHKELKPRLRYSHRLHFKSSQRAGSGGSRKMIPTRKIRVRDKPDRKRDRSIVWMAHSMASSNQMITNTRIRATHLHQEMSPLKYSQLRRTTDPNQEQLERSKCPSITTTAASPARLLHHSSSSHHRSILRQLRRYPPSSSPHPTLQIQPATPQYL